MEDDADLFLNVLWTGEIQFSEVEVTTHETDAYGQERTHLH